MSRPASLQELKKAFAPPENDPYLLHLLSQFANGRMSVSHGRELKKLRRHGYLDRRNQLTPHGQLVVKSVLASEKRERNAKK